MSGQPYRQFKMRRGLKADIPTLAAGELGFTTDTHELYAGSAGGNIKVNIDYDPLNDAYWSGSPPNNFVDALDRIAAAVHGLLGGPIP